MSKEVMEVIKALRVLEPRRPEFQTYLYHLVIVYFCTGNLSDFISKKKRGIVFNS